MEKIIRTKECTITLNLTNTEVRTINSIARNCRELCDMSNDNAEHAGLRKDLDTIINKCEKALNNQVKAKAKAKVL